MEFTRESVFNRELVMFVGANSKQRQMTSASRSTAEIPLMLRSHAAGEFAPAAIGVEKGRFPE